MPIYLDQGSDTIPSGLIHSIKVNHAQHPPSTGAPVAIPAMKMRILSLLSILASCSLTTVSGTSEDRHPVLLFPGLAASQMDAKINKKTVPHFYCRKQRDWFRIWMDPAYLLPGVIDCFFENMRMTYNETSGRSQNALGVETRVVGFGQTEPVEFLTASYHLEFRASMCWM